MGRLLLRYVKATATGVGIAVIALLVTALLIDPLVLGGRTGGGPQRDDTGWFVAILVGICAIVLIVLLLGQRYQLRPHQVSAPKPPSVRYHGWGPSVVPDPTKPGQRQVPYPLQIAATVAGILTGIAGVVIGVLSL